MIGQQLPTSAASPASGWRAYLLGPLRLEHDGQPAPLPKSAKARELLAYLLLNPGQKHARAFLAGLFWPEIPELRARRRLTEELYRLNQTLPNLLWVQAAAVQVRPAARLWVDVVAFSTALAGPWDGVAAAVHLYQQELLTDIYAEWVQAPRAQLHQQYQQALARLCQEEKRGGRYAVALEYARRLLHSDPLNEAAHCEAMRLQLALRQPQAALQQFEQLRQLLSVELGLDPAPDSWELAQAALAIAQRADGSWPTYLPPAGWQSASLLESGQPQAALLVGREAERTRFLQQLDGLLHTGTGGVILVEGEAGVGKTRLLQEMARDAEWRGCQVLWARATAAKVPYGLWLAGVQHWLTPERAQELRRGLPESSIPILVQLCPALAEWWPDGEVPSPGAEVAPARVLAAWSQVLEYWAQIKPLVLLLEDVHNADQDSVWVLQHWLAQPTWPRVLVVAAYRGSELRARPDLWHALEQLDRTLVRERLPLTRLDAAGTAQLARAWLGHSRPAEKFEARLYWETRGTPLYLWHLLRGLYESGVLYRDKDGDWATPFDATTADYGELQIPATFAQWLATQVAHLSVPLRQVLDAAAVLVTELTLPRLQRVSDLPSAVVLAAAQELVRRELWLPTATGYAFSHARLPEELYAALPPAARPELHRRAVAALAAPPAAPALTLAHHAEAGGLWGAALQYWLAAAEQARAGYAYAAAGAAYQRALALLPRGEAAPEPAALRWHTLCSLVEVELLSGDYAAALEQLHRAWGELAAAPGAASAEQSRWQLELCRLLAVVYERQSAFDQAWEWAQRGAHYVPASPTVAAARLYQQGGWVLVCRGEYAQAREWLTQALTWAQATAAPRVVADSQRALGSVAVREGQYVTARAHLAAALALYEELGDQEGAAKAANNLAVAYYQQHEYRAAQDYLTTAVQLWRQLAQRAYLSSGLNNLGLMALDLGDYPAAQAAFAEALLLARALGDRKTESSLLLNVGNLWWAQGAAAAARAHYEAALQLCQTIAYRHNEALARGSLSRALLQTGAAAAARAQAEQAVQLYRDLGERSGLALGLTALGHALAALGQEAAAGAAYQEAWHIRRDLAQPVLALEVQAGLARLQLAQGQPAAAAAWVAALWAQLPQSLAGAEDPFEVELTGYRVLTALHDPRAAAFLEATHARLQAQAARIADPALRAGFLAMPTPQAIVTAYAALAQARLARQRQVRLPRVEAPAFGRPLRADEWIPVIWTPTAPEDAAISDKGQRRRQQLQRLVQEAAAQGAAPTVADLAAALGVNRRTVLRDLADLRAGGLVLPTRGQRS